MNPYFRIFHVSTSVCHINKSSVPVSSWVFILPGDGQRFCTIWGRTLKCRPQSECYKSRRKNLANSRAKRVSQISESEKQKEFLKFQFKILRKIEYFFMTINSDDRGALFLPPLKVPRRSLLLSVAKSKLLRIQSLTN